MKGTETEKILKAVANKRRLAILNCLNGKRGVPVNIVAKQIKLSFRSTSKHLGVLYAADLVDKEQKSLSVFYSLNPGGVKVLSLIKSLAI